MIEKNNIYKNIEKNNRIKESKNVNYLINNIKKLLVWALISSNILFGINEVNAGTNWIDIKDKTYWKELEIDRNSLGITNMSWYLEIRHSIWEFKWKYSLEGYRIRNIDKELYLNLIRILKDNWINIKLDPRKLVVFDLLFSKSKNKKIFGLKTKVYYSKRIQIIWYLKNNNIYILWFSDNKKDITLFNRPYKTIIYFYRKIKERHFLDGKEYIIYNLKGKGHIYLNLDFWKLELNFEIDK